METQEGMGLGWQWLRVKAGWRQKLGRDVMGTRWRWDVNSMRTTDGDEMEMGQGQDRDGIKTG